MHYTAQVNAPSGLNVRKGPDTSYSVLRALQNGTKVTVTKEQNGWGYIGDGWISLEWVKKIADVAVPAFEPYLFRITCDVLNIRSGPGTNYPVIGQIKDKKRYTIVEERTGPGSAKGWGRLKAGGWVARDWIKKA
ncbi:MAG: SH3 domain-containing protein [Ruminococcus bromii]|nr:SH3 domain-containing protein [Ruminococcus bromii]